MKHHPALPYAELPAFMASLATNTSDAAHMLQFIIATVCRYNEVSEMNQTEVSGKVWTIPAIRMKADRPHAVPLMAAALACLPVPRVSDVAPANCIARHTNTPATTHGFRSTFRDWAGDCTDYPRELAEAALAHVKDDTEAVPKHRTGKAARAHERLGGLLRECKYPFMSQRRVSAIIC